MNNKNSGFALPLTIVIILVIMVLLPALVTWINFDTRQMVKVKNSTLAYNLAEAGIDRGMWKLKSSTSTFSTAYKGTVLSGYDFDTTYADIDGGYYRIRFSSGPSTRQVTILAEGKDNSSKEVRAIRAIYKNQSFPGAMLTGGVITWANAFSAHWGPIMAQNNINITDANAAKDYFPRKYSRQVVQCTIGSYPRDQNGLNPPNTDNVEWWSDYPVPELPQLDFATLRSSAMATGTLNVIGCSKMSPYTGAWWGSNKCNLGTSNHNGLNHFQNSWNHPLARKNYVWYWDDPVTSTITAYHNGGDVQWTGSTGNEGHGLWGKIIVMGNLVNHAGDNWSYTGNIPSDAWQEYQKIDTSATNEYPGDNGYHKVRSTFGFGTEGWTGGPNPTANTDIGLRGLIYIGGNFDIQGPADINGVVWVKGNVSRAVGSERTVIFFDDSIDVPTLNVVLIRSSWNEVIPSTITWH